MQVVMWSIRAGLPRCFVTYSTEGDYDAGTYANAGDGTTGGCTNDNVALCQVPDLPFLCCRSLGARRLGCSNII